MCLPFVVFVTLPALRNPALCPSQRNRIHIILHFIRGYISYIILIALLKAPKFSMCNMITYKKVGPALLRQEVYS